MGLQREVETPNIQGFHNKIITATSITRNGAFSKSYQDQAFLTIGSGDLYAMSALSFDASDSNTIYEGSTLQPSVLQVLACIRT